MKRLVCLSKILFLVVWLGGICPLEVWSAVARAPVEVLVREADLIAVVSVLSVQEVTETALATATLQIRELLKAPPGFATQSIDVRFQSMRVPPGERRRLFSDGPTYRAGERAVVFLRASPDGPYFETVRALLGKRTIKQDQVAYEEIGLDAFLEQIRAALSSPSVLPNQGSGKPSPAPAS